MRDIQPVLDELRTDLHALYGDRLVRLVLYGSHARGTAKQDSDVDVMVVLGGEVDAFDEIERMGHLLTDLLLKSGALISVFPISETDFSSRQNALLSNVRREGVWV